MRCPCNGCGGYAEWKAREALRLRENTIRFEVWLAEHDKVTTGEALAVINDFSYTVAVERAERREQMEAETRIARRMEAR